jgi:NADP-dependent 3-hydroxy acid dehydrogenase YdfG
VAGEPVMIITGASTGIGASTARLAVGDGYRVVLAARSEDKLRELAVELGGEERAIAQRCDVSVWEEQEALVAAALDRFGRVDVLGVAYSIRAALPHVRERSSGHFVLTSSVAGRRVLPGSLYSASKWAVTAMGEALRQELAPTDIKVTVIEPGMVDTPFFDERPNDALRDEDIARAVMFALSQPPHVDVNEILVRPIHQAG